MIISLLIGTALMAVVMLLARTDCEIPIWKTLIFSVLLTLSGVCGAKLMAFIESGTFNGVSFYGAVFFAPILIVAAALILRVKISVFFDIAAPAECIMLALLKFKCYIDGCCAGKALNIGNDSFVFPSQQAEMFTAAVLTFVLLIMLRYEKNRGYIYPWYMVIYGAARFVLNFLRQTEPFLFGIPAGTLWSAVSVIAGIVILIFCKKARRQAYDAET